MWDPHWILETIAAGLAKEEAALRLEQAPHGMDSWPELRFHPLLAAALREAGVGVFPEVPYPATAEQLARPALLRRDRLRCDLVLTHHPAHPPGDAAPSHGRQPDVEGLLFADLALADAAAEAARTTPPDEAYWLEVKVAGQVVYVGGVPRANRAYSAELLATTTTDIPKLAGSPGVRRAGLLVILMCESRATGEHDLQVLTTKALERGLPMGSPLTAGLPILDRVGNAWCQLALLGAVPGASRRERGPDLAPAGS